VGPDHRSSARCELRHDTLALSKGDPPPRLADVPEPVALIAVGARALFSGPNPADRSGDSVSVAGGEASAPSINRRRSSRLCAAISCTKAARSPDVVTS
jgi:hypothetical protein